MIDEHANVSDIETPAPDALEIQGDGPDALAAVTAAPGPDEAGDDPAAAQAPAVDEGVQTAADRPEGVPEKFWDPEAGGLRTDALLKSYRELERKLGQMVPLPADEGDVDSNHRLRKVLGVPDSPEEYQIAPPDERLAPDPELNAKLHEAGFNQRQAQLVYDLAAERVLPVIDGAMAEVEARRDVERLVRRFGGDEAWRSHAEQIKTWAEATLPDEVREVLASSYDGVLAMHQMMQAKEPPVLNGSEGPQRNPDEAELRAMMRDPRYWRDRDPGYVAQVTEGFRRLFAD